VPIIVVDVPGYVTFAELRGLANLGDTSFTDEELAEAREWFETTFEDFVGMAFVPREATERLETSCRSTIMLRHWPVRSVIAVRSYSTATAYTSFTAAELEDLQVLGTGEIKRYALGPWPADVELDVVHGQAAPEADIRDAALTAIAQKLLDDRSGARANRQFSEATDQGVVRFSMPGDERPFGIPVVDEVANRYRSKYKLPGIG